MTTPKGSTLVRLLKLSLSYRYECLLIFVLQVALLGLGVAGLGLSGVAIDVIRAALMPGAPAVAWPFDFAPPAAWSTARVLFAIGGAVLAMAAVRALLSFGYSIAIGKLVHLRLVPELRTRVFDKLQRLSFRFFDENATGSIINRVTGDVQSVRMFVDGVLLQGLIMAVSLSVYLAYMLATHAPLTAVCLSLSPALYVVTRRFSRRVRPDYAESRELADQMVLAMSEGLHGISVVKAFGREDDELARFEARSQALRDQQNRIFRQVSRFSPTINVLSQLGVALLLVYGGSLVSRGELSLGELIVFAGLLQQFTAQVSATAGVVNTLQQSLTAARRVFEVLDTPLEVSSPPDAIRPERIEGRIRFERAGFQYAKGVPVLRELDLEIAPGECVAIVGETGAGKSSLLSLVPRFFDVTSGRLTLDGTDVRALELGFLRASVGLVFQEGLLFRASVAENIAFGAPGASRERIERAARLACAHDFIEALPEGYDTELDERGANLSGGQRQRLAIARAILTEPRILLLDDPTTAVDPETEGDVLEAIDRARQGRTTLIVANRLTTLRRADRIVVLEEGRIVEVGTHDELLARRGVYFRMAEHQVADQDSELLLLPAQAGA